MALEKRSQARRPMKPRSACYHHCVTTPDARLFASRPQTVVGWRFLWVRPGTQEDQNEMEQKSSRYLDWHLQAFSEPAVVQQCLDQWTTSLMKARARLQHLEYEPLPGRSCQSLRTGVRARCYGTRDLRLRGHWYSCCPHPKASRCHSEQGPNSPESKGRDPVPEVKPAVQARWRQVRPKWSNLNSSPPNARGST